MVSGSACCTDDNLTPAHCPLPLITVILPAARGRRLAGRGGWPGLHVDFVDKQLGDVNRAAALRLTIEQAVDVRHATHIAQGHDIGVACSQVQRLALAHCRADRCVLEGKQATKTAALFGAGEFHQLGVGHIRQQRTRLAVDAQFAEQMTAGVIGYFAVKVGAGIDNPQHIDQKLSQFEGDAGQRLGPGC